MIENVDLIKAYKSHRKLLGRAPTTLRKELSIINLFDQSLKTPFKEVSTADVRHYFANLDLKVRTIETRIVVIKLFFNFLRDNEYLQHNPTLFLKCPKIPAKIPRVLSLQEIQTLLSFPSSNSFYDLRDKAILEMLYGTGIRQGELGRLTITDINFQNNTLLIYGKGNKERLVPLTNRVLKALKNYLIKARPQVISQPNQWLWLNKFGNRFCPTKFSRLVNFYSHKAGITHASCHTLRRSCATHLLQKGVNPYHIAKLLGHTNLKTIDHYLAVKVEDLRQLEL